MIFIDNFLTHELMVQISRRSNFSKKKFALPILKVETISTLPPPKHLINQKLLDQTHLLEGHAHRAQTLGRQTKVNVIARHDKSKLRYWVLSPQPFRDPIFQRTSYRDSRSPPQAAGGRRCQLSPLGSAHHHVDVAVAAIGADELLALFERHLGHRSDLRPGGGSPGTTRSAERRPRLHCPRHRRTGREPISPSSASIVAVQAKHCHFE